MKFIAPKENTLIPGFGITLGITLSMISLLVLIPLSSIVWFATTIPIDEWWRLITAPSVLYAFATSIGTSCIAAIINVVFGVLIAWVLVRYEFPGKMIINGLIEIPFALPTAVAGITLSKLYSSKGAVGSLLYQWGIHISYSHIGIIIALIFVGIPFIVRTVQPVLEQFDRTYEEAAHVLGASKWTLYRRIIFPEVKPAILTGFGLAFARGIGEYGSVIYISGNSVREHTQVVSYVIMQKLNYADYVSATVVAIVLLLISFLVMFTINSIHILKAKRVRGT